MSDDLFTPFFYGVERRRTDVPELVDGLVGRTCAVCHETKPLEHFTPNDHWRDGYNPRCRECTIAAASKGGRMAHMRGRAAVLSQVVAPTAPTAPTARREIEPTAPVLTLEEWLLEPPQAHMSAFVAESYLIVRVEGPDGPSFWLLRPPHHRAHQPQDAIDDGWLLALVEMLPTAPRGWVYGKSR